MYVDGCNVYMWMSGLDRWRYEALWCPGRRVAKNKTKLQDPPRLVLAIF